MVCRSNSKGNRADGRRSKMTFLTVMEMCNADFRTVYGCEAAKRYSVFFIAECYEECYEEIFGEEKSNV